MLEASLEVHSLDNYFAIGSGQSIAMGALHATSTIPDQQTRIQLALEAAATHDPNVRGPFDILKQ